MARRFIYALAACVTLAAAAVVTAVDRATEAITRGIDWMLGVLRPEPILFRIDGDYEPVPAFAIFSDPHVERHEAGISTRAAARGI